MRTIHLLTIGNSFSGNAVTYLERIAEGTDTVRFDVSRADLGGCSLEKHANLARYTDRWPDFKTYRLGVGPDGEPLQMNLQEALAAKPWDVVTLQQASAKSWLPETFEPWLGQLHARVRAAAPQADILLHQTWAYRSDAPFFPENGLTQDGMHRAIRENFLHYSAKYGCGILASGEALHRARHTPGRMFAWPDPDYDYPHAEAPALPREDHSFAVGRQWRITQPVDGIPVLALDARHLNARGCYLCGAVWFETLTGLNIHDSRFVPEGFEADDLVFLRETAHATVTG